MKKVLVAVLFFVLVSCGGGGGSDSGSGDGGGHSALCNDGTYSDSKSCSGTCSSHGGVKEWYVQCGSSASKLSVATAEADNDIVGAWVGLWTRQRDNVSGIIRLNITEKDFTGTFFNQDSTLNSIIHSYINNGGNMSILVDSRLSQPEDFIEYPAHVVLKVGGLRLTGSINIEANGPQEVREIELSRE